MKVIQLYFNKVQNKNIKNILDLIVTNFQTFFPSKRNERKSNSNQIIIYIIMKYLQIENGFKDDSHLEINVNH